MHGAQDFWQPDSQHASPVKVLEKFALKRWRTEFQDFDREASVDL